MRNTPEELVLVIMGAAFIGTTVISHMRMNSLAGDLADLYRHVRDAQDHIHEQATTLGRHEEELDSLFRGQQDPEDVPVARVQDRPVKKRTRKKKVVPAKSRLHTVTLVGDE